jgi:putative PIN family toxin of toxin-antitoxin system
MIRAVLDANVVVSAILSPKGIPARILTAWRAEEFSVVVSEAIMSEIGRVLRYPKIKRRHRWPEKQILTFLEDLAHLSVFTPGDLSLSVIADDPADNRYLEASVEGQAEYLVSGDDHLLKLGAYQGIQIINPREFLTVLKERQKT